MRCTCPAAFLPQRAQGIRGGGRHEASRVRRGAVRDPGAVSHQVKALEAELGIKLFNRERQRLIITEAGRSYLEVVRDAFDRIAAGTER